VVFVIGFGCFGSLIVEVFDCFGYEVFVVDYDFYLV